MARKPNPAMFWSVDQWLEKAEEALEVAQEIQITKN
jgi:hypothetical protein